MHAARAIKANREKAKDPKLKQEARRPSASSHGSRIPRSPAVSLDTKKVHPHTDDSDNLNFSYAGFLIAVFGAVPLIVGTFIEVPALWEIGLGVTLVGLFIGVVFWCTELCAEAKKFSQKKNQLSTRGKIEDSNLLQVPERKFQNGNGVESRRSSFQSDSVSLITPMAQSYGSPKHLPHLHHNVTNLDGKHSISQYSSSEFYSKSDESSATLSFSLKANGHLGSFPQPPPPPKLLLRGTRKDDSRVVSLVQPDPGLEDDSDSDAETVIEAPTGKPKIIQVQTLQEKVRRQSGVVLSVSGHSLMDPDASFHLENETVPPLVPLAQQHRTIRMPVMPQEVDKLQRCECGRYLLTERDKLVGVRLPGIGGGGSSMPTTTYNSPSLAGVPTPGAGTAPATRKVFTKGLPGSLGISNTPDSGSTNNSVNDISSSNPADNKIIDSNEEDKRPRQTSASSTTSRKSHDKVSIMKSPPMPHPSQPGSALTRGESVVQVEPTVISSDLLVTGNKTECVGSATEENEMESGDPVVSISPSGKTLRKLKRLESSTNVEVEDKDRVLEELLELTDVDNDNDSKEELLRQRNLEAQTIDDVRQQIGNEEDDDDDDEFVIPSKPHPQIDSQQRSNSANRPTSLALPTVLSDDSKQMTHQSKADDPNDSELGPGLIVSTASSASSASTVVFIGEQDPILEKPVEEAESLREKHSDDGEPSEAQALSKEMSLDELLDKLEEEEDGEVLAVVVQ